MKAYKYRSILDYQDEKGENIFRRDLECLANNKIYAAPFKKLNDPFEGTYNEEITSFLKLIETFFKVDASDIKKEVSNILNFQDKIGIYSLSKTFKHELLWAYYANGHNGYCLEYDVEVLKENHHGNVRQIIVDYKDVPPTLDDKDLKPNTNSMFQKLHGTKSLSWKHEEEVRLVFDNDGFKEYHPSALTAIYFGERMGEKHKHLLISSLENRDVKFYQLKKLDKSYEIKSELVYENKRNIPNRLDKECFEVLKTDHNPVVQNYYLLHKNLPKDKNELIEFTKKFKEEYCRKKCSVSIFDSNEVLPIINQYPYDKEANELYEKHLIHFSDFTE